MNNIWTLTKVFVKNSFHTSRRKNKKGMNPILTLILLTTLFFFAFSIPISKMVSTTYDIYSSIGQEGFIVSILISLTSVIVFFFGIIYVISTFYFSSDVEYLLPLPIKAHEILSAKFITVLLYEYLTEIIILLLPLGVYGFKSNGGPLYWVTLIIVFIVLPILPLVFSSIISMVIMSFTNIGKHKDTLRVIGGILGIGLGIGINIIFNRVEGYSSPEAITELVSKGNNSLVDLVSTIFPSTKVASYALVESVSYNSLFNLMLLILFTVISILLFGVVGNAIYFKGALGGSETFSKRKRLSSKEINKATKEGTSFGTYLIKEIRLILRTPTYFINCVVSSFIFPIIMAFFLLTGENNLLSNVGDLRRFLINPHIMSIVLIVATCVIIFITSSNMISATAISREGQNVYFMKYIPLSYKTQLIVKAVSGMLFGLFNPLIISILLIALNAPVQLIIALTITMILAVIASNLFAIIVDVTGPKLHWDNEQYAVKQNFRAFITTMVELVFAGGLGFCLIILNLPFLVSFIVLSLILLILNLLLYFLIFKNAEKWLSKL